MEIVGRVPEARVPLSMVFIGGVMRSYAMLFTASRSSPAEVGVQENEDDCLVGLTKVVAHGVMVSMATTLVIGSSGKLLSEKEDDAPRFFQLVVDLVDHWDFDVTIGASGDVSNLLDGNMHYRMWPRGATMQQSRFSDSLEIRPQMRGLGVVTCSSGSELPRMSPTEKTMHGDDVTTRGRLAMFSPAASDQADFASGETQRWSPTSIKNRRARSS
ncbi:hypothetical protein NE237_000450 [Protea cynaroides]|uniref:Uncharacterized protein n=1 Tax=Protea cynaroides TaxID=273540 RepID=A0A9Q0QXH7_9MAGN|nr:hypothetical protein NE237_000450 [Protea cynaroides]